MTSQTLRPAVVAGALALLLTACSPDSPTPSTSPAPTASQTSESASPTATSTLSQAEQEAFEQATDLVMSYEQTITDLYSGTRTRVNDLDNYATGDLLDRTRINVSQGLSQGYRTEPKGVQVNLISAEPVKVSLTKDPATVVVRTCIDRTAGSDVDPDGKRTPGGREQLDYYVVKTTYLPDPGWAVSKITGDPDAEDRQC